MMLVRIQHGGTTDSNPISDEDLLARSHKGDEEAFAALYRRRQTSVYRFALHMSGREEVAEEVTQDVFVALIHEPARFDAERGSLTAFLIGIARNHVLRQIGRNRNHVCLDDEACTEPEATNTDPLASLTREEAAEAVRQAVLSLPCAYREVVVLCDLEELSYSDAAGVLGIPVGTVRSRLYRGRALLSEKLRSSRSGTDAARCSA
jgi:RNA polymerase sigma-70 factor (ECF subfamily)